MSCALGALLEQPEAAADRVASAIKTRTHDPGEAFVRSSMRGRRFMYNGSPGGPGPMKGTGTET